MQQITGLEHMNMLFHNLQFIFLQLEWFNRMAMKNKML